MKRSDALRMMGVLLVAAVLAGCSTVKSVVRPKAYAQPDQAAITAMAQEVEKEIQAGNRDLKLANKDGLIVDTPEIKQALRSRAARVELINQVKDSGYIREKSAGLIEILSNSAYKAATTKLQRDQHALLIMNENENRWFLYEGIVKASNYPPAALNMIQEAFFQAHVALNKPNWKCEGVDAKPAKK